MRIIKPHGRSVTKKDQPHNRRILRHKKTDNQHDLEDFALRSPDLLIMTLADNELAANRSMQPLTPSSWRRGVGFAVWLASWRRPRLDQA